MVPTVLGILRYHIRNHLYVFFSGILHDSISVTLPLKKGDQAQIPGYTDKTTVAENQGKENLLKEEILIDQLTLSSWPLDKAIFENLPPRLRKGMNIKSISMLITKFQ